MYVCCISFSFVFQKKKRSGLLVLQNNKYVFHFSTFLQIFRYRFFSFFSLLFTFHVVCVIFTILVSLLIALFSIFSLAFFGLATSQNLGQTIPDATKEDGTTQILERQEGIMNAQQNRRQLEVDQKYNNAEIDQSMWCGNPIGFLVQDKDNGSQEGSFGVAVKKCKKRKKV